MREGLATVCSRIGNDMGLSLGSSTMMWLVFSSHSRNRRLSTSVARLEASVGARKMYSQGSSVCHLLRRAAGMHTEPFLRHLMHCGKVSSHLTRRSLHSRQPNRLFGCRRRPCVHLELAAASRVARTSTSSDDSCLLGAKRMRYDEGITIQAEAVKGERREKQRGRDAEIDQSSCMCMFVCVLVCACIFVCVRVGLYVDDEYR